MTRQCEACGGPVEKSECCHFELRNVIHIDSTSHPGGENVRYFCSVECLHVWVCPDEAG